MKKLVEKFYHKLFSDSEHSDEQVPYANKAFMFWFSIISFSVVLGIIIKDIIHNIEKVNP